MSEHKTNTSNKTFWLFGLICMITLSINDGIIIPVGLLILLILIAYKKSYQEVLKSNIKKSAIVILIGLFLAFGGMGLIFNIIKTPEKVGINFNFQLIPLKLINPIVGLFIDEEKLAQKIQETNNQMMNNPEILSCKGLINDIITKYNSQDFTGLNNLLRHGVEGEERSKITDILPKIRNMMGSLSGVELTSRESSNTDGQQTVDTENKGITENYGEANVIINCIFNPDNSSRERYNINIQAN